MTNKLPRSRAATPKLTHDLEAGAQLRQAAENTAASRVALAGRDHLPTEPSNLADDLLQGADQIAWFIFGDTALRRRVYHLVHTSRLPVFRMGTILCARKTRLLAWIEQEETRAMRPRNSEA